MIYKIEALKEQKFGHIPTHASDAKIYAFGQLVKTHSKKSSNQDSEATQPPELPPKKDRYPIFGYEASPLTNSRLPQIPLKQNSYKSQNFSQTNHNLHKYNHGNKSNNNNNCYETDTAQTAILSTTATSKSKFLLIADHGIPKHHIDPGSSNSDIFLKLIHVLLSFLLKRKLITLKSFLK